MRGGMDSIDSEAGRKKAPRGRVASIRRRAAALVRPALSQHTDAMKTSRVALMAVAVLLTACPKPSPPPPTASGLRSVVVTAALHWLAPR